MPDRFMRLNAVGHVGGLEAVAMVVDLLEDRLLVLEGGKSPRWISFVGFTMDPRAMNTGADIEKDKRGF